MGNFKSLTKICGKKRTPGTAALLHFTIVDELNVWPQTKEDLGGTEPGDSKILGEAFDFSLAASGLGYWRTIPILVNTGAANNEGAGDIGTLSMENRLPFFVEGSSAEQLELIDCFLQYSGCLIAMVEDKNGNFHVIGNLKDPCFIQELTGGTGLTSGDRNGHAYTMYANTGAANMLYDPTLGIDITPNP